MSGFFIFRGEDKREMKKKTDKGFTLVELIIILVILAIISALLIPTLVGYIDEARAKKYLPNAKSCFDAAQAMFSKQYGLNDNLPAGTPVVEKPGGNRVVSGANNRDQDITDTEFAAEVLRLAGLPDGTPYLFMVGVGSALQPNGTVSRGHTVTEQDKYTVYYAVYIEKEDSKAWYYYNGAWTTTNPRLNNTNFAFDTNNIILNGPDKGVKIQYYLIVNHNTQYTTNSVNDKKFWDWLRYME